MARRRTLPAEKKLADGPYSARCRETSLIGAAVNGHSLIWPESVMEVRGDRALFYREGKLLWECNTAYAALHFEVTQLPDQRTTS